jgi:hypothetical protein
MAAPKAGGMRFRGDLQGEPKPGGRLPECSLDLPGMDCSADEAESRPPPGAACPSLAVSERTSRAGRRPTAPQARGRQTQGIQICGAVFVQE